MFEQRLEISATLELLSPLHVGSGEDEILTLPNGEQPVRMAKVVCDHEGMPCLPGSTVKGILRRQLEKADAERICGNARDKDGEMGWLLVRMAPCLSIPPKSAMERLPNGRPETGIFVEARTRIDRAIGTAQDKLLYHAEMVAPATRFQLRLCLLKPTEDRVGLVRTMLAALTAKDGVSFGRGQTYGQGRIRLIDAPAEVEVRNGERRQPASWALSAPMQEEVTRLRLSCDGPYVALDSSKSAKRRKSTDDEAPKGENTPQLQGLVDGHGRPALRGSALLGVMRARAAWLMAREQQTDMKMVDDPDKEFTSLASLTPIERLFGVPGFRGMVQVRSLVVQEGYKAVSLTSVALDQFSMAPLDNALFTTKAFARCRFDVALALDDRAEDQDRALWQRLVADSCANGLTLGHGGNKGFGWFTVENAHA